MIVFVAILFFVAGYALRSMSARAKAKAFEAIQADVATAHRLLDANFASNRAAAFLHKWI